MGTIDDVDSVNTAARTQRATECLMNPLVNFVIPDARTSYHSIPPLTNVNQEIYPLPPTPMPLRGMYIYPYMPPLVIPNPLITQVDDDTATIFT